jgi:hypothetical protein
MFDRYRREVRRTKFLSRELYRSEIRLKWIIQQLTDQQLNALGVTHFDRDADDWTHRVIEQIDDKAITAHMASYRINGMSESWIRRLWPHRKSISTL